MFSDEILEKIFNRDDVRRIPLQYQSTMIHAIEEILEEDSVVGGMEHADISES